MADTKADITARPSDKQFHELIDLTNEVAERQEANGKRLDALLAEGTESDPSSAGEIIQAKRNSEEALALVKQMQKRLRFLDDVLEPGEKRYLPADLVPDPRYGIPFHRRFEPRLESRQRFAEFMMDMATHERHGKAKYNTDDWQRAQSEGVDEEGGYLVDEEQLNEIVSIIQQYGLARRLGRVLRMNKERLRIPTLNTRPIVYWPGEGNAPPQQSQATFDRPEIVAKRMMAYDVLTMELDEDAMPLIRDFLIDVFTTAMSREEDYQFFRASTAQGDPFNGLLNATGVQNHDLGAGEYDFSDLDYSDLLAVMAVIDEFVSQVGTYVFSNDLLTTIRDIRGTAGEPLWQQMALGNPDTINGRPYAVSAVMPRLTDSPGVAGTAVPFLLYGDFRYHAMGDRRRMSIEFSRHARFEEGNIVMRAIERVGFATLQPTAIGRIRTSAV